MEVIEPKRCGRYWIWDELASGGMARVHFGRLVGLRGFSMIVAIKRLLPILATDPSFVAMFAEEARLASRIRHPNVVTTLDVIEEGGEMFIVMEYIHGETLARLRRAQTRQGDRTPRDVAVRIVCDVLRGLHAAHEATSDGKPLDIVHRDVSPQNVLVGVDGVARVVDFGIAKAIDQGHATKTGEVKGKMRYVAPEQLSQSGIDRRVDIFAAGLVLWELLVGEQARAAAELPQVVADVMSGRIAPPSTRVADIEPALDAIVMRALERDPADRFAYASEMADALERACPPASPARVGEWVREIAREDVDARAERVREIEAVLVSSDAPHAPRRLGWAWTAIGVVGALSLGAYALARATAKVPSPPPLVSEVTQPASVTTVIVTVIQSASAVPGASARPPIKHHALPHASVNARDCHIPYVIDSTGVRVPKPECL